MSDVADPERERLEFVLRGIMKTSHEGAYHTGASLHDMLGLKWTKNHNLKSCRAAIDAARERDAVAHGHPLNDGKQVKPLVDALERLKGEGQCE